MKYHSKAKREKEEADRIAEEEGKEGADGKKKDKDKKAKTKPAATKQTKEVADPKASIDSTKSQPAKEEDEVLYSTKPDYKAAQKQKIKTKKLADIKKSEKS